MRARWIHHDGDGRPVSWWGGGEGEPGASRKSKEHEGLEKATSIHLRVLGEAQREMDC